MRKICAALIPALCLMAGSALAKTSVVVLPESFAGSKDTLMQQLGEAASRLRDGDKLLIYDGVAIRQIASIEPPTGPKTANPAWVRNQLAGRLAPALDFIRALPATSSDGGPAAEFHIQAILDEIGRNLIPSLPEKKADVLLIGSFLYYDPRNLFFSMKDGNYPLDADMTRSESQIPYGLAGLGKRLEGTTIHWCGPGQSEFVTAEYESSVKRWWTLYLNRQSARVGTFSYDLPTCFARLQSGQASGQIAYTPSGDPRIGMMHYEMQGETPSFGTSAPAASGSEIPARPTPVGTGYRLGPFVPVLRGPLVPRPTPPAPQAGGKGTYSVHEWHGGN